jgi:hypothetical protein
VHWHKPPLRVDLPAETSVEIADDGQHGYKVELRGVPIDLADTLLRLVSSHIPRL